MLVPRLLALEPELVRVLERAVDGEGPLADDDVGAHVVAAGGLDVGVLVAVDALVEAEVAVGVEEGELGAGEVFAGVAGAP